MLDIAELIRATALRSGLDPDVAVAVARQESGLNPRAAGDPLPDHRAHDGMCSFGLFQENICGGAGETHLQRGGTLDDLFDPVGATVRFAERFKTAAQHFVGESPGRIAAEAQRPYDPHGYAASVDAMLSTGARGQQPGEAPVRPAAPSSEPAPPIVDGGKVRTCVRRDPRTRECIEWKQVDVGGAVGGAVAAITDPVAREIAKVTEGAKAFGVAVVVIGAAAVLGYLGLRKTLD